MKTRKINFDQNITIGFFSIKDDHLIEATWIEKLILTDCDLNRSLFANPQIWRLIDNIGQLQTLVCDSNGKDLLTAFCDIQIAIDYFISVKTDNDPINKLIDRIIIYLQVGKENTTKGEVFFHFYKA